jgi:hypothetical protein
MNVNTELFDQWVRLKIRFTDGQSSIEDLIDSFYDFTGVSLSPGTMELFLTRLYGIDVQNQVVIGVRLKNVS